MRQKLLARNKNLQKQQLRMEAYWEQNLQYDQRPYDTQSIMGGTFNQLESEQSFAQLLNKLLNSNE
jgi:hypothetical protein